MLMLVLGLWLIFGWVLGMYHAASICREHANSLADTLEDGKGPGGDAILRNQLASALYCAWRIELWLSPWKWGRPKAEQAAGGKP